MADTTLAASTTAKASAAPLVGTDVLRVIRAATSYKATLADVATYVAGAMGALAVVAGSIELGNATDTTISRVSAGRIAVEGSNVLMASDLGTTVQAYDADLASWAAVTRAAGFDTFVATPSSANLAALITDEVGSSSLVFSAGTLNITAAKTLNVSNTITLTATDGSTLAIGTGGTLGTAAYKSTGTSGNVVALLDGANTWSANQTISGANPRFNLLNTAGTASTFTIGADSASAYLGTFTAASFTVYSNSTARATWASTGVLTQTSAGTPFVVNSSDSTARKLDFQDNTTLRGSIGADGTYSTVLYNGSGTALSRWTHSNGLMETLFALTVAGVLTPSSGILGTTGSGAAAAGIVGELASASATLDSVSLTTATAANVVSMNLTAGDWDVYGEVSYFCGTTTVLSRLLTSISPTSATIDNSMGSVDDEQFPASYTPTNNGRITRKIGPICVRLSGTTTYYLVGYATFTTSTCVAGGRLYARRRR